MITRPMPNGQLLCINQTSHALMAAEFCRHWGNRDFAAPAPYQPVLTGIAQHDNGWYEWELAPLLRADGAPMDFLHGPPPHEKLALWQRGIDRAAAQHPYAGLLTGWHASLLYLDGIDRLSGEELLAVKVDYDNFGLLKNGQRIRAHIPGDRLSLFDAGTERRL